MNISLHESMLESLFYIAAKEVNDVCICKSGDGTGGLESCMTVGDLYYLFMK
jgi:hypothetical protein